MEKFAIFKKLGDKQRKGGFCDTIRTQLNFNMTRNNNPSTAFTSNYFFPRNFITFSNDEKDKILAHETGHTPLKQRK